ncbi:hypothetical protein ACFLTQ_01545 [Chloroflexota bacterium]
MGCIKGCLLNLVLIPLRLVISLIKSALSLVLKLISSILKLVFRLVTFPLRLAATKNNQDEVATMGLEGEGATPSEPEEEETTQEGQG